MVQAKDRDSNEMRLRRGYHMKQSLWLLKENKSHEALNFPVCFSTFPNKFFYICSHFCPPSSLGGGWDSWPKGILSSAVFPLANLLRPYSMGHSLCHYSIPVMRHPYGEGMNTLNFRFSKRQKKRQWAGKRDSRHSKKDRDSLRNLKATGKMKKHYGT